MTLQHQLNKMFEVDDYDFYHCNFERHPFNVARDLALWIIGNINAEDIQHEPDWDFSFNSLPVMERFLGIKVVPIAVNLINGLSWPIV